MEESTRKLRIDLENTYEPEECYITTHQIFEEFSLAPSLKDLSLSLHNPDPVNMGSTELDFVDTNEMISDEIKVLIYVQDTIYHFFIDSLTMILKIHKEHSNIKFVLYLQRARGTKGIDNFYELLFLILDGQGVNYTTVSTVPGKDYAPVYKFNNYVRIDRQVNIHHLMSFLDVEYMADIAIKYSRKYMNATESVEPFRKLYISRGNAPSDLGPIEEDYPDYRDDLRMNDALKLEEFFVSQGYEAFSPEKKFGSIMEQIVYMSEVKTLASITSSGLANMIFMRPNQTIIEVQAELVQVMRFEKDSYVYPKQQIHNYYSTLSFMRQHTHISIPSRRDPDKVIKTLTSGQLSYLI
jgi:hypothetical protein